MSRLIGYEAERIGILKVFKIEVDGRHTIKFTGKNAQGKTTALQALEMLLSNSAVPQEPIQKGFERGKIIGRFETDKGVLIAVKKFKKSAPRGELKVFWEGAENRPLPSPQAVLDELLGLISFNPLDFCEAEPKEQRRMLLEVLGLTNDIDALDAEFDEIYKEREVVNREVKRLSGHLSSLPKVDPTVYKSFVEIAQAREKALATNRENAKKREEFQKKKERIDTILERGRELNKKIKKIQEQIATLQEELSELTEEKNTLREEHSKLSMKFVVEEKMVQKIHDVDVSRYDEALASVEENNRNAEIWRESQRVKADLEIKQEESKSLSNRLQDILKTKESMLLHAHFPIKGLSVDDEGVRFDGVLVNQASKAQKLLIGCSVLSALNPKLRVVLIDDAEKLDSDGMKILEEWAEREDFYILMALVEESGDVGIVFEEGEVVKDNYVE